MRKAFKRTLAIGLVAGLILVVAPGGALAARKKIKVANFYILNIIPLLVAKEKGFYAKEGLDAEMIRVKSSRLGATALITGEVDISGSTPLRESILAHKKGKKLIRFYSLADRMTMDLIVRKEVFEARKLSRDMPIEERFKALKGMKFGVNIPGSLSDVITRYYLRRGGLDPDRDAHLVNLAGGRNFAPALRAKRVDAFMLSPPVPVWLEQLGFGTIFIKSSAGDVPEFSDYAYVGVTVMHGWLGKNGDTARAFSRAMNGANKLWRSNLDVAADVAMKTWRKLPRNVILLGLKALLPPLSPNGIIKPSSVTKYMDFLYNSNPKKWPRSILDPREGVHYTNKYNPSAS